MAHAVDVSVEVAFEHQVQEITYDGQEIYQQPLSMSESLTKLAHKIDFGKVDDEESSRTKDLPINEEKSDEEAEKELTPFQPPAWPWETVRAKLQSAYTEVCVLADVLSIAKEKEYLVLDPVSQENIDQKPIVQMLATKKSLAGAAAILITGAERLRLSHFEMNRNRAMADFHLELLNLRQKWRLKKVGNLILGDLSYRTAGSRFWQSGVFEVSKSEPNTGSPPSPNSPVPRSFVPLNHNQQQQQQQQQPSPPRPMSVLKVTIPSELEGSSFIQVIIQKDQEKLCNARLTILPASNTHMPPAAHWQLKLEQAQNVLFCKELFAHLAKEAVQLRASIPHMVVGNQIATSLFPGIQVIIGLCHGVPPDSKTTPAPQKGDLNFVLEHSLHQLLREVHFKNSHHPMPHPTTATLGVSKRRRLAGPEAHDRHTLAEMFHSETLLEQIVRQAQHVVLRLRTMYVIDTLARELKDPLIVAHWNSLNSPTHSCVKIYIVTHGYEVLFRTSLIIHVNEVTLRAICKDGRIMELSYEPQELRDLILYMMSQHQVTAVQALCKLIGWTILSSCNHVGVGTVESLANASSVILASPFEDQPTLALLLLAGEESRITTVQHPDQCPSTSFSLAQPWLMDTG